MLMQGSFALSSSGDSILVYVQDGHNITFVYGLSTIPWETDLSATLSSSTSNLPSELNNSYSLFFPYSNDNGLYSGFTHHKILLS